MAWIPTFPASLRRSRTYFSMTRILNFDLVSSTPRKKILSYYCVRKRLYIYYAQKKKIINTKLYKKDV